MFGKISRMTEALQMALHLGALLVYLLSFYLWVKSGDLGAPWSLVTMGVLGLVLGYLLVCDVRLARRALTESCGAVERGDGE